MMRDVGDLEAREMTVLAQMRTVVDRAQAAKRVLTQQEYLQINLLRLDHQTIKAELKQIAAQAQGTMANEFHEAMLRNESRISIPAVDEDQIAETQAALAARTQAASVTLASITAAQFGGSGRMSDDLEEYIRQNMPTRVADAVAAPVPSAPILRGASFAATEPIAEEDGTDDEPPSEYDRFRIERTALLVEPM